MNSYSDSLINFPRISWMIFAQNFFENSFNYLCSNVCATVRNSFRGLLRITLQMPPELPSGFFSKILPAIFTKFRKFSRIYSSEVSRHVLKSKGISLTLKIPTSLEFSISLHYVETNRFNLANKESEFSSWDIPSSAELLCRRYQSSSWSESWDTQDWIKFITGVT